MFVLKFNIDVCVFNQGHDVKNQKMKISTIHTSDYLRLYGYDLKKVAKLQYSDWKIYLFFHTKAFPVTGFYQPKNHYSYLQLQNKILPNALDYDEIFNNNETEVYEVEENEDFVGMRDKT